MATTRRALLKAVLVCGATTLLAPTALAGVRLAGVDHLDRPVSADSPGGWRLVMFGYTHCPDVCPVGLQTLTETIDALGPLGERITPVFVTVDPARDKPAVMKEFVPMFHARLVGVTPSPEELAAMAAQWRVKYARVESGDGKSYSMDHTATIFLVDPASNIIRRLSYNEPPKDLANRIRAVFMAR
jgi:cytochrome oxidase Cu insertion factor (SCO1/SenC/PrrC family)